MHNLASEHIARQANMTAAMSSGPSLFCGGISRGKAQPANVKIILIKAAAEKGIMLKESRISSALMCKILHLSLH